MRERAKGTARREGLEVDTYRGQLISTGGTHPRSEEKRERHYLM